MRGPFTRILPILLAVRPFVAGAEDDEWVRLPGHDGSVLALAASPQGRSLSGGDSRVLASGGEDGAVRLWESVEAQGRRTLKQVRTLSGHQHAVTGVSFAPDGLALASSDRAGGVKLWDVATGQEKLTLRGHEGAVTSVLFAPDGSTLASAGADGTVRLWVLSLGRQGRLIPAHEGHVRALALSDDGKLLASAGDDGLVKLWDAERKGGDVGSGTLLRTLRGHEASVRAVAFYPGGRLLASGGADGTLRVWTTATGEEVRTLRGHAGAVTSVAFSWDHLASAGADGTVRFWAFYSGLELRTLRAPEARAVRAIAFLDRGRHLAFGDDGGILALWDVGLRTVIRDSNGRLVATHHGLLRPQRAIFVLDTTSGRVERIGPGFRPVWSSDGRYLAFNAGSPDGRHTAYAVWDGSTVRSFGHSAGRPILMAGGPSFLVTELLGRNGEDGEKVVTSEEVPPRLVVHDLASGEARTLPLTATPRPREHWAVHSGPFAVSPSGDAIALMLQAGRGNWHIHPRVLRSEVLTIDPAGTVLQQLGPGTPVRYLASGELVIAENSAAPPVTLEALSLASGRRRPLFRVPSWTYDLSSDGRRLVYMQYEKDGKGVYVWDTGGEPRRLIDGEFPGLSPDGSLVAFGRRGRGSYKEQPAWDAAVYVVRIADGTLRRYEVAGPAYAPPAPSEGEGWWAWAPDGRRLALTLEEPPSP